MKLFARQLIHKHQSLHEYSVSNDVSSESLARIERELDDLIGFNMFLMVAGLEPRSSKVSYVCVLPLLSALSVSFQAFCIVDLNNKCRFKSCKCAFFSRMLLCLC